MTRKRTLGAANGNSQDQKDLQAEIKRLNKSVKDMLAKAGKSVREVRGEVSRLKKVGIVSQRIDARTYVPSRYMLSKIRKNRDILSGEVMAVAAPKSVRKKYTDKGIFEQRGGALIVPREYENQKTKIKRGLVEISRALQHGQEQRLILPFKATDMEQLATRLKDDPTLDGLKEPDELFGFRLFGHNMATIGFPNVEELADYISVRYTHLFSGRNGREGMRHFVLFRFKSKDSAPNEAPQAGKIYHPKKRTAQTDWYANLKRERESTRKKKARERETETERKNRLDKQRIRSAQNRQRKFDEK